MVFLSRIALSEEKEKFEPKFSIKLTGGYGYVSVGDLNRILESLNGAFVLGVDPDGGESVESITGEIKKLNNFTPDLEVELRIDISPKFSLGISSSGYFHKKNESSLHVSRRIFGRLDYTDTFYTKPEVKAWIPVKLGIYYGVLRSSRINVFLTGGIGYYSASASEYKGLDEIDFEGRLRWRRRYWKVKKASLGFNGGIGVEYSLTKNLALVVEAQGRYARLKNLKGTMQLEVGMYGNAIIEEKGTLYYFNWYSGTPWIREHSDLEICEEQPANGGFQAGGWRKAILDLSGYSLRAGIRIKLL